MAMDVNGDGQLTVDKVTDARLKPMLNRADANQNGLVTREEFTVMEGQQAGGQGGAPPAMGQVLLSFMQDQLGLNAVQRAAIAKVQSEVDA